jgi:hypothetical protein
MIMPFSFHGQDIFWINYLPFKWVNYGIWDPYGFIKEAFPQVAYNYYLPLLFFIISAFDFLFRPFLPLLGGLFSIFETWNFSVSGNTVQYASIFYDFQLFRTLFVFKLPYLVFDFAAGWLLFKILSHSRQEEGFLAYKLWMFNPFILHSCYALGQMDIIPTFFVVASIYFSFLNRRYWAVVFLSFGVLTKVLPVVLIFPAILIFGGNLRERLKLGLVFLLPLVFMHLPFWFSSGDAVFNIFFAGQYLGIPRIRFVLFVCVYFAVLLFLLFLRKKERIDLDVVILTFTAVLLLFYSLYNVTLRYFVLITPLLIYIAVRNKKFWFYNIIFLITLFELRAPGNTLQWGLFSPLHPEFFSSLPILDSYLNLAINVLYIHQFMYRLFIISSLAMVIHILLILTKKGTFKFSLSRS